MSSTASMYTIGSAVVAAEEAFLGPDRVWTPKNDLQKSFLDKVLTSARVELPLIPEFKTIAALSEIPINKFLKDNGFDIQLDEFPKLIPPERAWGAASVLDVLMQWKKKGRKTTIAADGKSFVGARLDEETAHIFEVEGVTVAMIETQSGDTAWMSMRDTPVEHFELLDVVQQLSSAQKLPSNYEGLMFPAVDLNHEVDISWLLGLSTYDDEGYFNKITQALQQTKLKMNHVGARIKDAVALGGMRCASMPNPPLVINRPFLFWVMRPGLSRPLFAAHITQEHWKDPGSLEM